jgi:hypothetical protein
MEKGFLAAVVMIAVHAGCTERSLEIDTDGAPGVMDLLTPPIPKPDLARTDLAGVDLAGVDLAEPVPDLAMSVDLAMPLSCQARFGSLPGYLPCGETATTCRFSIGNEQQKFNCAAACGGGGSTCLSEWEVDGVSCDVGTHPLLSCSTPHHEVVCICSR